MKKIILAVVLGLILQALPARVMASGGEYGAVAIAFGIITGLHFTNCNCSKPVSKEETVAQAEFSTLNSMTENLGLLNQTAGGSMDTAEILK